MAASEQPMSTAVAAPPPREEGVMAPPIRANIGRLLCVAVPLVLWFAPIGIDTRMQHVLAIAAFMIVAWITEAIDYAVAGFVGCYLYWALRIVPLHRAFRDRKSTRLNSSHEWK